MSTYFMTAMWILQKLSKVLRISLFIWWVWHWADAGTGWPRTNLWSLFHFSDGIKMWRAFEKPFQLSFCLLVIRVFGESSICSGDIIMPLRRTMSSLASANWCIKYLWKAWHQDIERWDTRLFSTWNWIGWCGCLISSDAAGRASPIVEDL